eukprot:SAG25_NODE_645_length_6217_cov_5.064237_2_plen_61_part_00
MDESRLLLAVTEIRSTPFSTVKPYSRTAIYYVFAYFHERDSVMSVRAGTRRPRMKARIEP